MEGVTGLFTDKPTVCYIRDQIKKEVEKFNPSTSINFSELAYKNMLITADRLQCINRIRWENLPNAWTSQDIETLLYNYGSICCFQENDNIVFAPYTLGGKVDIMGRLYNVQPITLDGKAYGEKKRAYTPNGDYIFDPSCCIIIHDYTGCVVDDKILPRVSINTETTINDETKTYKLMLYNIIMSIKKLIVTCETEEQAKLIIQQSKLLLDPTQPILALKSENILKKLDVTQFVDKLEIDELTRAIDYYNKIRRNFNGVPAPSTFEKKERMISSEVENQSTATNLIVSDAYFQRLESVQLINTCFDTNISISISKELGGVGNV